MRDLLLALHDLVERLESPAQRLLLSGCTAALVLFAGTTVAAARDGDAADALAGAALLAAFAVMSAVVWSVRRASLKVASRR